MYVNPSTSFEATAKFPSGLTGTLGVRIIDNAGATTTARTTSGIAEYPAGSGIYAVTLTSPGTAGQYSIVWDDADGHWAQDDLIVTTEVEPVVVGTGNLYVTSADLKEILQLNDTDFADAAIDIACAAASRAIDGYKGMHFYSVTEARYYTASSDDDFVDIDNAVTVTEVAIDSNGDGSYDTIWTQGAEYLLDPPNAQLDGQPKRRLIVRQAGGFTYRSRGSFSFEPWGTQFPVWDNAIRVTGTFGWAAVPAVVTQAAVLLANRFLTRSRQAPLGILVTTANDAVSAARLGRIDPDAAFLLDNIRGGNRRLLV